MAATRDPAPPQRAPGQTEPAAELGRLRQELAAVLVENGRLRREASEREAQQTASADVLRVISEAPADVQPVLEAICETAARLTGASTAAIHRLEGTHLRIAAVVMRTDRPPALPVPVGKGNSRPLTAGHIASRTILERRTIYVADLERPEGHEYPVSRQIGRDNGWRSMLDVPLLRRGEPIGVLAVQHPGPDAFSQRHISLLETFADQAEIAIENARLLGELQASNATLKDALERQTATSDILGVIAESTTDLPAVMEAILERALRLCGAVDGTVRLLEGDELVIAATVGDYGRRRSYRPGRRERIPWHTEAARRLILEQRTLYYPDTRQSDIPEMARHGILSELYVPLPGEGVPLGGIIIRATQPHAFSAAQIALVETFAQQAAIAVRNARLLAELHERDERRRQELERASAIQQRLLPEQVAGWPEVLEVAVQFRSAVETSGDFFDVQALPAVQKGGLEPLQIAVGDVAGKGMAAALVTALARSALHASVSVPPSMVTPAATLRTAGQRLHQDVGGRYFVACALAVVEPPGLHHRGPLLRLANAAQVPVLLVRDGRAEEVEPPGYRLPLGAEADGAYREVEVELCPWDVVVFSSDGLAEAPARAPGGVPGALPDHLPPPAGAGELFGFERLQQSATYWATHTHSAEALAAGIWSDLTAWCGEASHHDDMTLLVLRAPPAARSG